MTPVRLTSQFKRRMAALVLTSSLLAWLSISIGYHLLARRQLISVCRTDAAYLASFISEMVQQRPVLWRYDGAKIVDRISAQGPRYPRAILVRDTDGVPVELGGLGRAPSAHLLWGHAPVRIGPAAVADVWVGADARSLWHQSLAVALLSGVLSAFLGLWLYLAPVHTVAAAERDIVRLMARLTLSMQEGERSRIARDLHDGVGQAITAARLGLLALRRKLATQESEAFFDKIAALLDGAIGEVRRSTTALMPPALGELGLRGAIVRHCESFADLSSMTITCEIDGSLDTTESHAQIACYRIVQEAVNNCAKHAKATQVFVRLSRAKSDWSLEVVDNGRGFDVKAAKTGSGLTFIQERAELLGGKATLSSSPAGTRVLVVFPHAGGIS